MRERATVQIFDWDFVLSPADRYLIEHFAGRAISPFPSQIESMRFEIVKIPDAEFGAGYEAKCQTELLSGKVVETVIFAAEKRKLIGAFGSRLRHDLRKRIDHESGFAYRLLNLVQLDVRRFIDLIIKNNGWPRTCSRKIS